MEQNLWEKALQQKEIFTEGCNEVSKCGTWSKIFKALGFGGLLEDRLNRLVFSNPACTLHADDRLQLVMEPYYSDIESVVNSLSSSFYGAEIEINCPNGYRVIIQSYEGEDEKSGRHIVLFEVTVIETGERVRETDEILLKLEKKNYSSMVRYMALQYMHESVWNNQ